MRIRAWVVGTFLALVSAGGLGPRSGAWAAEPPPRTVRVAVYDDLGTSRNITYLLEVLDEHPNLRVERIKGEAIRAGRLADFDVVIHPGGSGGGQGRSLEAEGREKVRDFVRKGGGYVGICAGAYLASCDYAWSLHILDARVVDKQHWARGTGDVDIALTARGNELLGLDARRSSIFYFQGPLLAPAGDPEVPDYEVLARFDGEIAKKGAPAGVMRDTTAIAAAPFGSGRVLCFSPHPERTGPLHDLVYRAVLWTTEPAADRASSASDPIKRLSP
jgi:glutamine amidotransferase-like uncharacterized protein